MNPIPLGSTLKCCSRCLKLKHVKEFLRTNTPLQEIVNGAWNQPGAKLATSCYDCRQKRKSSDHKRNAALRRKRDENRYPMEVESWEQILATIRQGFYPILS
jgi:hypothetical protein